MGIQLKNNAVGYLATAINASDTGAVLQTGNGAAFPALGATDYFYATLRSTGGAMEVVKVTARSGDSITIVRAQEGTSAASFGAGSRFEMRVTAQSIVDTILKYDDTVSPLDYGAVGDGVADDSAAILAAVQAAGSFNRVIDGRGRTYRVAANCTDVEPTDLTNSRYFDIGFLGGSPSLCNMQLVGADIIIRRKKFVTCNNLTIDGKLRVDGVWFSNFKNIYVKGIEMMGGNGRINYDDGTHTDGDFWGTYWNAFENIYCWWQGVGSYNIVFHRSYGPVNQNSFINGLCNGVHAYMTNGVTQSGDVNCQNNVFEFFDIGIGVTGPDGDTYCAVWDTQYGGTAGNEGRLELRNCYMDAGIKLYGDIILNRGINGQGGQAFLKAPGSYEDVDVVLQQGFNARIALTGEGQQFESGFDKHVWATATSYGPQWFQTTSYSAWAFDATEPFGYGVASRVNIPNDGAFRFEDFRPQAYIADGAGMTLCMYWRPVSTNGLYLTDTSGSPCPSYRFPYGASGWELLVVRGSDRVRFMAAGSSGANLEFYVSPAISFTPGRHMNIPAPDSSIRFDVPLLIGSGHTKTAYSPWDNIDSRLGNLYGQRLKKQVTLTTGTATIAWTVTVPTHAAFEVEVQLANTFTPANVFGRYGYGRATFAVTRGPAWAPTITLVAGPKVVAPASGPGNLTDVTAAVVGNTIEISATLAAYSPVGNDVYDTALIMRSVTPRTPTVTAV